MKLTEILDAPEHWCQNVEWTMPGPTLRRVCLSGALRAVVLGVRIGDRVTPGQAMGPLPPSLMGELSTLYRLTEDVLTEWYPSTHRPPRSIPAWNDARDRTFEEVQAVAAEVDRRRVRA